MQAERVGGKERSFEIIARNVRVHLRCVPELAMRLRRLFLCIKGLQSSYSSLSHLYDLCSSIQFSTLPLSLVWALLCSFFSRPALLCPSYLCTLTYAIDFKTYSILTAGWKESNDLIYFEVWWPENSEYDSSLKGEHILIEDHSSSKWMHL